MDITTANRLYELRKQHGYSQDELAEMLNVSRQAVSKWERSESSPDTDNLIALARLYNVSLDQLLGFDVTEGQDESGGEGVHIDSTDGIHISDSKKHVCIDETGIHVRDKSGEKVDITGNIAKFVNKVVGDIHVDENNDEIDEKEASEIKVKGGHVVMNKQAKTNAIIEGCVSGVTLVLSTIAFVLVGCLTGTWHPTWLLFFLPLIAEGITRTITHRNPDEFPVPIIALGAFLLVGFLTGAWHPYWLIFIAIPAYYIAISPIKRAIKAKEETKTVEIHFEDKEEE